MSKLLDGRLTLIIGGGKTIGKAVSLAFAQEGAKIIIADVDKDAAEATLKEIPGFGNHQAKFVNVAQSSSVQELFAEIKKETGVPDVLVNCVDIVRDSFMLKMTEEMFDVSNLSITANLKFRSASLLTQAAGQLMVDNKIMNASIINVGSVSGKIGNKGQCNYSASKAFVESFTKRVAKELGGQGIRCNAVMSGFIETPMLVGSSAKVKDLMLGKIPMQRFGQPEEVAEVCVFLASNRSSYVNGSIIEVSGGLY